MGAGDSLIDKMLAQGIAAVESDMDTTSDCPGQKPCPMRTGIHALLLDAQDRRKNVDTSGKNDLGALHVTGWSTAIGAAGYIILKLNGVVP